MTTQEFKEEIRARTARSLANWDDKSLLDPLNWDTDGYRIYADALGYPAWLINRHLPMGEN